MLQVFYMFCPQRKAFPSPLASALPTGNAMKGPLLAQTHAFISWTCETRLVLPHPNLPPDAFGSHALARHSAIRVSSASSHTAGRASAALAINFLTIMVTSPTPAKRICQPYPYLKHSQTIHFFGTATRKKRNSTRHQS